MANSGNAINFETEKFGLRIDWVRTGVDANNNYSTVKFTVKFFSVGSTVNLTDRNLTLQVNGTNYSTVVPLISVSSGDTQILFEKTVNITHNSDGTKTFKYKASLATRATISGTYFYDYKCPVDSQAEGTLGKIQQPSTITAVSTHDFVIGTNLTVTISSPAGGAYHRVLYSVNGNSWTTIYETRYTGSFIWDIPEEIANSIPAARSGILYLRADTVIEDMNMGSSIYSHAFSVPDSYAPALTYSMTHDGLSQYIRGKTNISVNLSAACQLGAYPVRYELSYGSKSKSVLSENTTETITFTIPEDAAASMQMVIAVTDSRGYTDEITLTPLSTVAYVPPEITAIVHKRGNIVDGEFIESNQGKRVYFEISGTIESYSSENDKKYKIEYRTPSQSTYTTLVAATTLDSYAVDVEYTSGEILEENTSYVFKISLIDYYEQNSQLVDVSAQRVLLNFKANGRAVAIGGIANDDDTLEIKMRAYQTGGVQPMPLASETDFDELTKTGFYVGNATTGQYANCPVSSGFINCEVAYIGTFEQLIQRVSLCSEEYTCFVRVYYQNTWSEWNAVEGIAAWETGTFSGKVLLSSGLLIQWGRIGITTSLAEVATENIQFSSEYEYPPRISAELVSEYPYTALVTCGHDGLTGMNINVVSGNSSVAQVAWTAIGKGA